MPPKLTLTEALRLARRSVPLTLAKASERMGGATYQAASRIELAADRANLRTLAKYVRALGGKLIVEIRMLGKDEKTFRGDV